MNSLPLHPLERLDQAVCDLFGLTEAQRDLVNDFTQSTFDLFSNGVNSTALQTVNTALNPLFGTISCLPRLLPSQDELAAYLRTFLEIWNRELAPQGEFGWRVISPENIPMIAVVFTTQERGVPLADLPLVEEQGWDWVLETCEAALRQPISRRIYVEGMIRAVTDTFIIIMKRDERRLWTRSMAREDAEAALLQAVNLQQQALVEQ